MNKTGAFEGVNVRRLAAKISTPELAHAWVNWCKDAETLKRYHTPQGVAYNLLMETPNARPPFFHKRVTETVQRRPTITGRLADKFAPPEGEDD